MASPADWAIPAENVKKYENLFENMDRIGERVSGEVMRKFLRDTKLPVETLRAIWDLSDLDQDGYLDRFEFILTMHLVCVCLEGRPLPRTLPLNLVPPNKRGDVSEPLALMPPPSLLLTPSSGPSDHGLGSPSSSSVQGFSDLIGGPPPPMPEWAISKAEQTKYAAAFMKMDTDFDGLVTGADVRDFFIHSSLPQTVLAQIWNLVDFQHTGCLNQEQFIVAVYLANEQIASRCTRELPSTLPPALIPPSLRPVILDSKEYEESNKLVAEIEKLRKERQLVKTKSAVLLNETTQRSAELSNMTAAAETLAQTARSLTVQRSAAERYVADRSDRLAALRLQLSEISEAVKERKAAVEALGGQLVSQQISLRSQEAEVVQLRNTIATRKREESGLLQQFAERRSRVEAVEAENKAISSRNDLEAKKISNLETMRDKLLLALDQYAKLLAGDADVVEPEEDLIQQLTATITAEKELASESGQKSTTVQPLFQMNTAENLTSLLPSSPSEGDKNGLFEHDPFSTDAFSGGGNLTTSAGASADPFDQDPFVPATCDPFSPRVKSFSDHSKSPFDPNKFDAIFGSAPSETTDYPFNSSVTNPNGTSGGAGNGGGGAGKKVPPPRPPNQPNVSRSKNSGGVNTSSRSTNSPKSRFRGAFGKVGGNGSASRGHGTFRIAGGAGREATAVTTLNEEEQMRWATRESRRAARQEEKLRAQEEADLALALRLSRLEANSRDTSLKTRAIRET